MDLNFAQALKKEITGEAARRPDGARILAAARRAFLKGAGAIFITAANPRPARYVEDPLFDDALRAAKKKGIDVSGYRREMTDIVLSREGGRVFAYFGVYDDATGTSLKNAVKIDVTDDDFHLLMSTDAADKKSKAYFLEENGFICEETKDGSIRARLP